MTLTPLGSTLAGSAVHKSLCANTYGHVHKYMKIGDFKSLRAVTYGHFGRKSLRAVTYENWGGWG
jgi:hypothetical protein